MQPLKNSSELTFLIVNAQSLNGKRDKAQSPTPLGCRELFVMDVEEAESARFERLKEVSAVYSNRKDGDDLSLWVSFCREKVLRTLE